MASRAVFRARNGQFRLLAEGRFLEGQLQIVTKVAAPFRPGTPRTASAAAEECVENIVETAASAAESSEAAKSAEATRSAASAAVLEGRVTELVVLGLLLRIGKHAVSFVDFLELFLRRFRVVAVQVRVIFARQLLEGFLDLVLGRTLFNADNFILIAFIAHNRSPL